MAKGQLTYLQLTNRVLQRLGKGQVSTLAGVAVGTDSWTRLTMDGLNDAQAYLAGEYDWSTLFTTGTFSTALRTYDLSSSFSSFGRAIDLVDTTNRRLLREVMPRDIDAIDPLLTTSGTPSRFTIEYPSLLFDYTPSATTSFRLRYLTRPTALASDSNTSDLPEYCDRVLVDWVVWQMLATREDASDGGAAAERRYRTSLGLAMAQDCGRIDRLWVLLPVSTDPTAAFPRLPSHYPPFS